MTIEISPLINFGIDDLKKNNWTKCNDFASMYQTTPVLIYSLLLTTIAYVLSLLTLYLLSTRMVSLLKKREKVLGTSFQRPISIIKAAVVILLVLYMPIHVMRNIHLTSQLPGLGLSQYTKAYIEAVYTAHCIFSQCHKPRVLYPNDRQVQRDPAGQVEAV